VETIAADERGPGVPIDEWVTAIMSGTPQNHAVVICRQHRNLCVVPDFRQLKHTLPRSAMTCGCSLRAYGDRWAQDVMVLRPNDHSPSGIAHTVMPNVDCGGDALLQRLAEMYAAAVIEGAPVVTTTAAIADTLAEIEADTTISRLRLIEDRWFARGDAAPKGLKSFSALVNKARSVLTTDQGNRLVELSAYVTSQTVSELSTSGAIILVAIASAFDTVRDHTPLLNELVDILLDTITRLAPSLFRKPKAAWAPLFETTRTHYPEAIRLALNMPMFTNTAVDIDTVVARRRAMLNEKAAELGVQQIPELTQIRLPHLPKRPVVTTHEIEMSGYLASLPTTIDPIMEARAKQYEAEGVKMGVDGIWNEGTAARVATILRYQSPSYPDMTLDMELKAAKIADALFDSCPQAFIDPLPMTPKDQLPLMEKKFSPGLPYIGVFKTRRQLIESGHMQVIMDKAIDILKSGQYPDIMLHTFVKEYVSPKLRGVTATELLDNFIANFAKLEANKRVHWSVSLTGSGMPLTESAMGPIFSKVAQHRRVIGADFTAADSTFPPMGFEVLAKLYERGLNGRSYQAQMTSLFRASKRALQRATIIDLHDGTAYEKMGGGATGQSATSPDNTWIIPALVIDVWSELTGRDPLTFFDTNTFANTSDDNAWGTDDDFDFQEFIDLFRARHDMIMRLEWEGRESMSYLGRVAIPGHCFAHEYEALDAPVPEWSIVMNADRMRMRRSALKARHAVANPFDRYIKGGATLAGHIELMGHQPHEYSRLVTEWETNLEAGLNLKPDWKAVTREAHLAQGGALTDRLGMDIPLFPTRSTARINGSMYNHAVKLMALPSYEQVVENSIKPIDMEASRSLKKYKRLMEKSSYATTLDVVLGDIRQGIYDALPPSLLSLAPKADILPAQDAYMLTEHTVENFIWRVNGAPDDLDAVWNLVRGSPYSPATDIVGWKLLMGDLDYRKSVMVIPLQTLQNRALSITGWYLILDRLIAMARHMWLIGLVIQLWELFTQDMPRIYSFVNTINWHATGRSSSVLSALQPRDQFAFRKRVAATLAEILPIPLGDVVPWDIVLLPAPTIVEWLARALVIRQGRITEKIRYDPHITERWVAISPLIYGSRHRYLAVDSPTATGKTSSNIYAGVSWLSTHSPGTRIFLVVPTKGLLMSVHLDRLPNACQQRLEKGVKLDAKCQVFIATYGHLLARLPSITDAADHILLADEVHIGSQEIQALCHAWPGRVVYLSATLDTTKVPAPNTTVRTELGPRFKITNLIIEGSLLERTIEYRRLFPKADRVLVIASTKREADEMATTLQDMGIEALYVPSGAQMPATGWIVATPYVRVGVDIKPHPVAVVSSGTTFEQDGLHQRTRPTTYSEYLQERGRVGRAADGQYVIPASAGTGTAWAQPPSLMFWSKYRSHMPAIRVVNGPEQNTRDATGLHLGYTGPRKIAVSDLRCCLILASLRGELGHSQAWSRYIATAQADITAHYSWLGVDEHQVLSVNAVTALLEEGQLTIKLEDGTALPFTAIGMATSRDRFILTT
jgi:hypothetical protein